MRALKDVIIVGGNTAGLACAIALCKIGMNVTVLEAKGKCNATLNKNHFLGLWSPCLKIIQDFGIYDQIEPHIYSVLESGYRSVDGQWVIKPLKGLKTAPDSPSLCFIKESYLFEALMTKTVGQGAFQYIDERVVQTVTRESGQSDGNQNRVRVWTTGRSTTTTTSATQENISLVADLLVVADGANSSLRQIIHPHIQSPLAFQGYSVLRGHSPFADHSHRISEAGFQTWGPGARFACVPTTEGNAWFAAITWPHARASADPSRRPASRQVSIPLADLRSHFASWHSPILDLLSSTEDGVAGCAGGTVVGEEAWAFDRCISGGLSGVLGPRAGQAEGVAVAFVGDAAHTLDPILAQGAGVAVEDAARLAHALRPLLHPSTPVTPTAVATALSQFEQARSSRFRNLHWLSRTAQVIGHVDSESLCRVRDVCLKAIPHSLKGMALDELISLSLSTQPFIAHFLKKYRLFKN